MVWSLSKDDDGLDSVHPLPTDGGRGPSVGDHGRVASSHPGVTPAVPKVLVDPISQLPQAPNRGARRRSVEQTLILKGRKLDEMRAHVEAQRAAHRRRKQMGLLSWAFAGGIALSLGWLVGVTWNFGASDDAAGAAANDDSEKRVETPVSESASSPDVVVPEMRSRTAVEPAPEVEAEPAPDPREVRDTLDAVEMLPEAEATAEAELSPQQPTDPEEEPTTASAEAEAFTLDDLPFD